MIPKTLRPWSAFILSQFQVLRTGLWAPARAAQHGAQCGHPPYDMPLDAASGCHSVLLLPEADGKG